MYYMQYMHYMQYHGSAPGPTLLLLLPLLGTQLDTAYSSSTQQQQRISLAPHTHNGSPTRNGKSNNTNQPSWCVACYIVAQLTAWHQHNTWGPSGHVVPAPHNRLTRETAYLAQLAHA